MEDLKVGDCVQLMHGYTPKMTVSAINEAEQSVKCVWFDTKKGKHVLEDLPLNTLKKFNEPPPLDLNALRKVLR
jgi:uncharacterized protein YodC (DUF2158 family)